MKLNKGTSFALIHVLNGLMQASQIAAQPNAPDVRSVQRALQRLVELGLVTKQGSNNNQNTTVSMKTFYRPACRLSF